MFALRIIDFTAEMMVLMYKTGLDSRLIVFCSISVEEKGGITSFPVASEGGACHSNLCSRWLN